MTPTELAREAVFQFVMMLDELHPGFSRMALDELWAAVQTKYGSAQRQVDIAVGRATQALTK